jgi:hypothetical protein
VVEKITGGWQLCTAAFFIFKKCKNNAKMSKK